METVPTEALLWFCDNDDKWWLMSIYQRHVLMMTLWSPSPSSRHCVWTSRRDNEVLTEWHVLLLLCWYGGIIQYDLGIYWHENWCFLEHEGKAQTSYSNLLAHFVCSYYWHCIQSNMQGKAFFNKPILSIDSQKVNYYHGSVCLYAMISN